MPLVYEIRASTILHNLLLTSSSDAPWLVPANVCPIVPLTFLKAGRCFEFVDIEDESLCLSREEALRRLREAPGRFGGILFVRTYGVEVACEPFFAAIEHCDPNVTIVDDRCLCPPLFDEALSPHCDVTLYSTGYAKMVDIGFGGYAMIDEDLAYRRHDFPYAKDDLDHLTADYKDALSRRSRFNYTDCNWLSTEPPDVPLEDYRDLVVGALRDSLDRKRRINDIYRRKLPPSICLDERFQNWRFNILVPDKQKLLRAIFDQGLFASSHYDDLTGIFSVGDSPVAARLHQRIVNLFNDRYFSEQQAESISDLILRHLE